MAIQLTLIIFITITITLTLTSAFSPTDHYLINSGPTTITTPNHRLFTADQSTPFLTSSSSSIAVKDHNPDLSLSPIYTSARVFTKPSFYKFKIKERGFKLIRLHFKRFDFGPVAGPCHDQFHVSANGYVLLFNFTTLFMNSKFPDSPIIKDFIMWVDGDQLVVKFVPFDESSFAFVNAVEVISAPKDLMDGGVSGNVRHGYENVYRVNVGGVKVTPFNDSLWRNWIPDDKWLKVGGGKRVHFDGRIQYRVGGASREAGPDNVYNSARVLESFNGEVARVNMTWVFPVKKGFSYLVRLHFCDIESISIGMIFFNVYVNGDLVYENLDLSTVTSYTLASPFYADFVVDSEKLLDGSIRVDIGPSSLSKSHAVDGILNGLEIWKMDNAMRSFDGEVFASQLESRNQSGGQVSRLLSLTAAVCLLAIAFLVMRRKTEAKNSVGWSRVPSEIDLKSNYPKPTGVSV